MTARLPAEACVAALACLPGMGPAVLRRLLADPGPEEAWVRIRQGQVPDGATSGGPRQLPLPGTPPARSPAAAGPGPGRETSGEPGRSWVDAARALDAAALWERCRQRGIGITWTHDGRWPARLVDGPQPPAALFWRGDGHALAGSAAVAIIGTRRATPDGRSVAFDLGRDVAAAGVTVVSGLALGIDGAAHAGALEAGERPAGVPPTPGRRMAPTVGVAAGGVDVVYPRRHADLWRRVVAGGVVVSEAPPGCPPAAWRFPARNRIIAALADMVVVVESHAAGGSLVTVEAALARGVEVRSVPGPVRSPASVGTNQLLCDGAAPVRHAADVLDGLGRVGAVAVPTAGPVDERDPEEQAVLDAVDRHPTATGRVLDRTGLTLGAVRRHLDHLAATGAVVRSADRWSRRVP